MKMWCCPDGGTCHHDCRVACFRVLNCAPFSDAYKGGHWPEDVSEAHQTAEVNAQ